MDDLAVTDFKKRIWDYYRLNKRTFPWRETQNPYYILVSELMLQQTQTDRVIPKYQNFIAQFPTVEKLAEAPLTTVLHYWQGLGYNRRALYLKKLAEQVQKEFNGIIPDTVEKLDALPGIGYATACAIVTYSFNTPTVFIETNIRTVFIHYFFSDRTDIKDAEINSLVALSVDYTNPREWYYALMDYGVMLKKSLPNPGRRSAHYTKQSTFLGSDRKIRGEIIRLLLGSPTMRIEQLNEATGAEVGRLQKILARMVKDGLLKLLENSEYGIKNEE